MELRGLGLGVYSCQERHNDDDVEDKPAPGARRGFGAWGPASSESSLRALLLSHTFEPVSALCQVQGSASRNTCHIIR